MGHKKTSETSIKQVAASKSPRLDKQLAWLLRRGANTSGLAMDEAGWARVSDVLRVLGVTRSELEGAIASSTGGATAASKARATFDVSGNKIRAHEGHWPRSVPVKLEALEASWDIFIPDGPLWHGVNPSKLRQVSSHGLAPGNKSHVRLETNPESRELRRSDLLVEISPRRLFASGMNVYRARNGAVLVRQVPPNAIVHSAPTPRNRRHFEADLQALLEG